MSEIIWLWRRGARVSHAFKPGASAAMCGTVGRGWVGAMFEDRCKRCLRRIEIEAPAPTPEGTQP